MLNTLTKKRGKKGFTLMELLIVVAIIAILVAISIPVFTNQLEKAREATDAANLRAAKAVAVAEYLTADDPSDLNDKIYDVEKGTLVDSSSVTTAYGKGTDAGDDKTDRTSQVIKVTIDTTAGTNEPVKVEWVDK